MKYHAVGTRGGNLGTAHVGRAQAIREGAAGEGGAAAEGPDRADGADAQRAENSTQWRHGGYTTAESLDVRRIY